MQGETVLFPEFMWWALVILFGFIALAYITKLCWLKGYVKREAETFQLESFLCVRYMPLLLTVWSCTTGEVYLRQISLQWRICLCLWLFVCVCAIMQSKVASRMTWGEYIKKQGREFLAFFTDVRRFFLWMEHWKSKLSVRTRVCIGLGALAIFCSLVCLTYECRALLNALTFIAAILFFIFVASISLHACRKLLLFWLLYSALFAACVVLMLPRQENGLSDTTAYLLFVFLYTFFWLLLAGAADDKPVQMGCNIVNTVTTIALIVINVSAVWAERHLALPKELSAFWSTAQYYSTLILLPLVVAGYLAALLKSIQIYQQSKSNQPPP